MVLRGLARAFPEITAQRAREEQEERDQLQQFNKREHPSRHDGAEDRQGGSTRSKAGLREDVRSQTKGHSRHGSSIHPHPAEDREYGEDDRRESPGRGPSRHTGSRDVGYHSQSGGRSRVESITREPSMHTNSRDVGYQSQSGGHSRVESIGREPSMHTSSRDVEYHSQSRGLSRVESIRREPSMHTHSRDVGYHSQSRGLSRVESNSWEPSMHSNSKHPGGHQSQTTGHSGAIFIPQAHSNASKRRSTKSRTGNLSVVEEIPIRTN